MTDTILSVETVIKRFGKLHAVDGVSLTIGRGEFFALLGGSGSGKSTLLRLIAGLEQPDGGTIRIDGQDVTHLPAYARPTNIMFQSYALLPHMDVAANIGYGLRREGLSRDEIAPRVEAALALVQLEGLGKRRPHQLSGGQRQRVALARALVKRPKVLLLDEPLSALDKKLRAATQFELKHLNRTLGLTFVMVTHDQDEALAMASRIAIMDHGKIVEQGAPRAIWERPRTRFVADFIGAANIFEGSVERHDGGSRIRLAGFAGGPLPADCALPDTEPVAIAVRPERVVLDGPLEGVLDELVFEGERWLLSIKLAAGPTVRAALPAQAVIPEAGAAVRVGWAPEAVTVLEG